jgi:hypothetical protein
MEKTQEQLDRMRNLVWQNGKLVEQIEKLTKMLEEKDDSTLVVEINEAKRVLADAINTKGGESTGDESFQQLAEDIQTLPYAGISAEGIVQNHPFSLIESIFANRFNNVVEIINDNIESTTIQLSIFPNLQKAVLKNLRKVGGYFGGDCPYLYMDNMDVIYPNIASQKIVEVQFGKINESKGSFTYVIADFCRNVIIGSGTDANVLIFSTWTATNVIIEGQSGIDELNSNLYNNLLTKLYDHSNDGETRTLRLGWLAHVTQENIDYANSKGWTLTT